MYTRCIVQSSVNWHALAKMHHALKLLRAFVYQRMFHVHSGGQKRKLSLAISFTGQPQFVLCDEPSSGKCVLTYTCTTTSHCMLIIDLCTMYVASKYTCFVELCSCGVRCPRTQSSVVSTL
jgi:ABC-type transporter Mla maintaining outer membrane lipid asymmetry ATPase subunit MlaF